MIGCLFSTGVSWARYLVVPDLVVSVTFGSLRTFFTHWDSPRVDTRYFTPSTSTGVTGICCGCLPARLMTVSVSLWTAGRHCDRVDDLAVEPRLIEVGHVVSRGGSAAARTMGGRRCRNGSWRRSGRR